jgi:hypothetical protein
MIKYFKSKPIQIEALQWHPDDHSETFYRAFIGGHYQYKTDGYSFALRDHIGNIIAGTTGDFIVKGLDSVLSIVPPGYIRLMYDEVDADNRFAVYKTEQGNTVFKDFDKGLEIVAYTSVVKVPEITDCKSVPIGVEKAVEKSNLTITC